MGSKGSSTPQTVSTSSSPPAQVLANYGAMVNRATNAANTPYQPYPGEMVAPLSNQTQAGLGGASAYANTAQPYYSTAGQMTQNAAANPVTPSTVTPGSVSPGSVSPTQFSAGQVNQFMNPYTADVVNSTQAEFNNQNQQAAQFLNSQNIGAGAFGGDRAGVSQAILANQQNLAQAPVIAGLNQANYNQALSEFNTQQQTGLGAQEFNTGENLQGQLANQQYGMQAQLANQQYGLQGQEFNQQAMLNAANQYANLGTGAQAAGLQGAMGEMQAGIIPQNEQQQIDTALQGVYTNEQAYPFQTTGWLGNLVEGLGSQSGGTGTTTSPGPSTLSQGIGAATAGLGVLGNLFAASDIRLKEDVEPVGETYDGQKIYKFRYKGDPKTRIGLMAHEVEHRHPEAVAHLGQDDLKMVDYDRATGDAAHRGHFQYGGMAPQSPYAYPPLQPQPQQRPQQRFNPSATLGEMGVSSAQTGMNKLAAAQQAATPSPGMMLFANQAQRPGYQSGGAAQLVPQQGVDDLLFDAQIGASGNPSAQFTQIDPTVLQAIGGSAPVTSTPYSQIPGPAENYPAIDWQNPAKDFQTAGAENSLAGLINRPGVETPATQSSPPAAAAAAPAAAPQQQTAQPDMTPVLNALGLQASGEMAAAEGSGERGSLQGTQSPEDLMSAVIQARAGSNMANGGRIGYQGGGDVANDPRFTTNPRFIPIQYGAGGGRSGPNAPIYTALNLGAGGAQPQADPPAVATARSLARTRASVSSGQQRPHHIVRTVASDPVTGDLHDMYRPITLPMRQPYDRPPVMPQPYDPLSSIRAPAGAGYDPLSSIRAPGAGPPPATGLPILRPWRPAGLRGSGEVGGGSSQPGPGGAPGAGGPEDNISWPRWGGGAPGAGGPGLPAVRNAPLEGEILEPGQLPGPWDLARGAARLTPYGRGINIGLQLMKPSPAETGELPNYFTPQARPYLGRNPPAPALPAPPRALPAPPRQGNLVDLGAFGGNEGGPGPAQDDLDRWFNEGGQGSRVDRGAIEAGPGPTQGDLDSWFNEGGQWRGGRIGRAAGGQLGQTGLQNSFSQIPQAQGITGPGPGGQGLGSVAAMNGAAGGFGDLFGGRPGFQSGGNVADFWQLVEPSGQGPLSVGGGRGPPQPPQAAQQQQGQQSTPQALQSLSNQLGNTNTKGGLSNLWSNLTGGGGGGGGDALGGYISANAGDISSGGPDFSALADDTFDDAGDAALGALGFRYGGWV